MVTLVPDSIQVVINQFLHEKSGRLFWTIRELLETATVYLRKVGFDDAKNEARWLLSQLLEIDIAEFYKRPDMIIDKRKLNHSFDGLARRMKHEPAAYIIGRAGFYGREFQVGPGVLIPRADTEILIEHIIGLTEKIDGPINILDTCTGSGCIGITLALELISRGRKVLLDLADISDRALFYARQNLSAFKLEKIADCNLTDLWPCVGQWQIITANPPYIVRSVLPTLQPEVTEYEPAMALDGGTDGMDFYRRLITEAGQFTCAGGILALEHGYDQADSINSLLLSCGWHDIIQLRDYGGQPRVTSGRSSENH